MKEANPEFDASSYSRNMPLPPGFVPPCLPPKVRNPVQRGHRFQCKADSIPVITDSG